MSAMNDDGVRAEEEHAIGFLEGAAAMYRVMKEFADAGEDPRNAFESLWGKPGDGYMGHLETEMDKGAMKKFFVDCVEM